MNHATEHFAVLREERRGLPIHVDGVKVPVTRPPGDFRWHGTVHSTVHSTVPYGIFPLTGPCGLQRRAPRLLESERRRGVR